MITLTAGTRRPFPVALDAAGLNTLIAVLVPFDAKVVPALATIRAIAVAFGPASTASSNGNHQAALSACRHCRRTSGYCQRDLV